MILQVYFAKRFAISWLMVFGILGGVLFLTDMVEQINRFDQVDVGLGLAVNLAIISTPQTLYRVLPILTVFATIAMYLRMARTSELVVTRAAGRSAIRSLFAPMAVAFLIGCLVVTVLNPITAAATARYAEISDTLRNPNAATLSVGREGLWLRQPWQDEAQVVIHADGIAQNGTDLVDVTFLFVSAEGSPFQRIQAERAQLTPGAWVADTTKTWQINAVQNPERTAERHAQLSIPTDLTPDELLERIGRPETVSIWQLTDFIQRLESAGFSAQSFRVWLHMEIASPVFFAAMVLVGATFTMRHTRFGGTGLMVLTAVLMGFGMYFVKSFAQVLGDTGKIPVLLAAWAPPVAAILLSLGLLLHKEDG